MYLINMVSFIKKAILPCHNVSFTSMESTHKYMCHFIWESILIEHFVYFSLVFGLSDFQKKIYYQEEC